MRWPAKNFKGPEDGWVLTFGGAGPSALGVRASRVLPRTILAQLSATVAQKILLFINVLFGGARGSRTPDLLNAIQALSQLSYGPFRPGIRYQKSVV